MPLPIASSLPLTIPASAFNPDHLAILILSGSRYGGDWVIHATFGNDSTVLAGELSTDAGSSKPDLLNDPEYPDRATETAFLWLVGETRRLGWRVVAFENFNRHYSRAERPYFCLARAAIADGAFEPLPGVTYADDLTLDAVMGYSPSPVRVLTLDLDEDR